MGGLLKYCKDIVMNKDWTPWTVRPAFLWSNEKPRSEDREPCDQVTCSECPGGMRCCQYPE